MEIIMSELKKDPWEDNPWRNCSAGQPDQAAVTAEAKDFLDFRMVNIAFKFSFIGQVLMIIRKEPCFKVPTIGVRACGAAIIMGYNPYFIKWFKTNPEKALELDYIIYHEILHVVLHHVTDRRFGNNELANIAEDLAINCLIPTATKMLKIPVNEKGEMFGAHVESMKKIPCYAAMEPLKSADYYYDFLIKNTPPSENPGDGINPFDSHDEFGQNEIADEVIRNKVEQINKADLWGDVGAAERVLIMEAQIRRINWAAKIIHLMGQYDWRDREATRKRPNRRMKFLQPGTRALTVDKHLLAIDTSGSVDNSLLSKFLGVINQLQGDFYIDVMQFDCEKTSDPVPYKRRKANFEFKGRGGTDFGPVFEMCKTRKYKSVIILTDGQAAAPEEPKLTRVLWVLPSKDYQPPVSWGEKVHLSQGG